MWLDEWEIQPGDMIGLKISLDLENSIILLVATSNSYFVSDWSTLLHPTLLLPISIKNASPRFVPLPGDHYINRTQVYF